MAIIRNIQIAKKYNVTPATVGNWIEQAKNNKLNLDITTVNGRTYLEDTPQNHLELERLKQKGAKYRSKQTGLLKIKVNPKIYTVFPQEQLVSLFVNISYFNFIPVKLSYTGEGAKFFEEGFKQALENPESGPTIELNLIDKYFESILTRIISDNLFEKKINLIELGADNSTYGMIKGLKNLQDRHFVNKYISLGISPEMANIRQKNIIKHVDIPATQYIYDVEENIVRNFLFKEKENNKYINLCTLLFSGLSNIRNVPAILGNLVESLSPSDYLLLSTVLGDDSTGDWVKNKNSQNIVSRHIWLLDLLGLTPYISSQFYNYDSTNRLRTSYFIMNRDIELEFEIENKKYTILLERDEKITFFVSNRYTSSELLNFFANAGFIVDQYNTDREQKFALFLLRVRKY